MKKSHIVTMIAVAGLFAAGCGSSSDDASSSNASPSNAAACNEFATANNALMTLFQNGKGTMQLDAWKQAQTDEVAKFDIASLHAHGDVKERLNRLVSDLPSKAIELAMLGSGQAAFAINQGRVEAACNVDGQQIHITKYRVG